MSGMVATCLLSHTVTAHAYGLTECTASRFGDDLNCSSADVSVTGMAIVGDTTSCTGGSNITLDLAVMANFATPDRWDAGIFISNDGKSPKLLPASGGAASCSVSILPTTSPFLNLDSNGGADTCGDGNKDISGGTGTGILYMTNVSVPCQALSGSGGNLYIPFVVSWDDQASPAGKTCTSAADPVPNTKAKCNAPTIAEGTVNVVVLPTITKTDGIGTLSPGGTTSYSIVITNTTGDTLGGAVFKDPAVTGINVSGVSCAAAGGATCPAGPTVAAMRGAGITIPSMPVNGSVTFTINATLAGNPGDTRTNTASVTVGGQTGTASDTDTLVGTIAILPTNLSKQGSASTQMVFNYNVYNFGANSDTISLSALSSQGWTTVLSAASVTVPSGSSTNFTLTVEVPAGASSGTVDITTITAKSGLNPDNTATATAVTTVNAPLTLTPDNTGSGGKGSSVFYEHRVQNNTASSMTVTFATAFSGACASWTNGVYKADKVTLIPSATVTLAPFGGYEDIAVKVTVPSAAATGDVCTVTTTATAGVNSALATDTTTVRNLILYSDPGYTDESYLYPAGNSVYAKAFGLTTGTPYYYKWYDSNNVLKRTSPVTNANGPLPDTYTIPATGPLGTWRVEVWRDAATDVLFAQTDFYVGPDHVNASYTGANPAAGTNATVNLALHDRYNHVVPLNPSGNLVKGNPPTTKDPLKISVTVSGSATIVSTTLGGAVIAGQTVTGMLNSTTGTATITITDSLGETVTITPASYNGALYGSSLSPTRNEPATVTFDPVSALNHIRLEHTGSGLTCAPSAVTVKACLNATCSALSTNSVTTTLSPASGWSANPITFTGSTTVNLAITTPQTVTLGTSAASPTPSGTSPQCFIGATADCGLGFADTGFIFTSSSGGAEAIIPTQIAGTSSGTFYLRAVKKSSTTQACEAALTGANTVNFANECNNPATCYGANLMSVNGGASTVIARNDNGSVSSYTPVSMTFDASGNAPFTFNYGDVGRVALHVSKTVNSALLTGSSNAFVVKPGGFVLSSIKRTSDSFANPAAADATGTKFVKAGEAFAATVTATTSGGATTPNYGNEAAPEGVMLTQALVAGLGLTNNPALSNGGIAGTEFGATGMVATDADGEATVTNLAWNEAGIITLTPSVGDGDYLGAGDVVGTASGNVGRFYAGSLALSGGVIANRTGLAGCAAPAGCGTFTYMGEQMSAVFNLTAKAVDGSTTLQNYKYSATAANNFAKFDPTAAGNPLVLGAVNTGTPRTVATLDTTTYGVASGSFANGVASVTAPFAVTRGASPSGPFEALDVGVNPADGDGAALTVLDLAVNTGGAPNTHGKVGSTKARYGRLKISNAHGSELLKLPVALTAQYWNGTAYVTNVLDNNSTFAAADVLLNNPLKNLSLAETSVITPPASVVFVNGTASYTLAKPGGGDGKYDGSVDMTVNVLSTYLPAAKPARATFGVYKGNNEFIYMREAY